MPYCPKCDTEFIEGITVCTDCGGPLVESEEAFLAMKKQKEQNQREEQEQLAAGWAEGPGATQIDQAEKLGRSYASGVYQKKSQKYEELKSSASAFIMVGTVLLVFSLLCWLKIINLPLETSSKLLFQTVLTVMGIASVAVSAASSKSAKGMVSQIDAENKTTEELIGWFTGSYTADFLDQKIQETNDTQNMTPEEISLKRYELIQDLLITGKDLPDQAYVDMLAEEIYDKLFED